jgi:hypothetical protein
MGTRKKLARARKRMAASPVLAPAVRRSLTATLGRVALHSPDAGYAAAAADALAHFRTYGWGDDAWDSYGVPQRKRFGRAPAVVALAREIASRGDQ